MRRVELLSGRSITWLVLGLVLQSRPALQEVDSVPLAASVSLAYPRRGPPGQIQWLMPSSHP